MARGHLSAAIAGLAILSAAAATCAAARSSEVQSATDPKRLNVLFIAIDDLRPELGCYGVEHARSPRLDTFAESAMVFDQHFVQAPSCGPSRAALLTGRSPARSGRLGNGSLYSGRNALAREEQEGAQTMPELFRRNGYRTVCIGKISHTADGRVYAYDGTGDGRDELPHAWDELATPLGQWERGWGVFFAYADGKHREDGGGHRDLMEFAVERDTDLPDGLNAIAAAEKLRELAQQGEPFFLGVGFFKPHLPFVAPAGDRAAYEEIEVPPPAAPDLLKGPHATSSGEFMGYHMPFEKTRPLAGGATLEARRAYLACVRYVDRQVGVVLDALDAAGLTDSTIVVIWGDHGWHLGDSGLWGKHTLFDRSLHSALMVRAPGTTRPGSRSASIVTTLDLYPTLIDLCALTERRTSHELDGLSLRPVLDGSTQEVHEAAKAYWGKGASIRTATHRLVARRVNDGWNDVALFRTSDGPDPIEDCAAAEPDLVRSLLERLDADR